MCETARRQVLKLQQTLEIGTNNEIFIQIANIRLPQAWDASMVFLSS